MEITGEFVGETSGSLDRRPGLDRLVKIARSGKLDLVAVFRFDRFARSTRHLLHLLDQLRAGA
jgi:DNA invertase Pin-like site-specific DNA recombinase